MAELATIARPYAEALFKASPSGDLDGTVAWLDALAAVAGQPAAAAVRRQPEGHATEQVFDVVADVRQGAAAAARRRTSCARVIENGRLAALPEIAAQFRALKNAQSGSSDAVVYSAFPIDAGAAGRRGRGAGKALRPQAQRHACSEDPSLIGGIRVVVGDEVLDTSVKARLEQMKVALTA